MVIKLISRILIFSSIIFLISYLALYLNPDYETEYVAGVIPKQEKLEKIQGKKIVIIGGSNASFGIDTSLMEMELGVPVVNMSLHGGLPLKFILEQVKGYLNKGDVLILSKEYSGLKNQYWNKMSGTELPKIVTYNFSQFKVILSDRKLFESTITGVFKTIKHYIARYPIESKKSKKTVYSLEAFDGDNLRREFITGKFTKKIKEKSLKKLRKNTDFINELNKYKEHYDAKGVSFYLTPPVIVNGYYKTDEILPFWVEFSKLSGISMLSDKKKYTYNKKYFFNSHYHTNDEGRKIRTLSLIEDIVANKTINILGRKKKSIFIANKEMFNEANLDKFTKVKNYKILKRDVNGILIEQSGDISKNYFRMRFENKDYKGYNLQIKIKSDTEILENLRFRGIGKKEKFDTIINLGDDRYELWKKIDKVFYKDNNSYIGISLMDNKDLVGKNILINDVGLYKDFNIHSSILEEYLLSIEEDQEQYFKLTSQVAKINLKNIINKEVTNKTELMPDKLYRINREGDEITISDFYTRDVIYKTKDNILFRSSSNNIIRVFE